MLKLQEHILEISLLCTIIENIILINYLIMNVDVQFAFYHVF